jgi:hypothetical protein
MHDAKFIIFSRNLKGFGRSRHCWEDNIKMDWVYVDWFQLAETQAKMRGFIVQMNDFQLLRAGFAPCN